VRSHPPAFTQLLKIVEGRKPRIRREGEEPGPVTIAQLSLEVEGAGIAYQPESGRPAVGRELRQRQSVAKLRFNCAINVIDNVLPRL